MKNNIDFYEIESIEEMGYEDVYDISLKNVDDLYLNEPNYIANNIIVHNCHPAGIVISNVPLEVIAPMRRAKENALATQYDMEDLESIGLIKMDILALSTLTVVSQTVKMIKNNYGITIDVENLPVTDEKTYELFRRGDLTGVFQCENPGMQHTMRDISVDKFDDIMAAIALYRPGPMGSIPDYCMRKKGEAVIDYVHVSIEPYVKKYLQKTYGILVYQEQLMQICNSLAGFSILDGYVLIKGVGKKKQNLIDKFKKQFIQGCVKNGVPESIAEIYWDKFITPFASYGFNKSHACCYALLSYITGYLKANYPDEFFCVYLNVENQRKNQDKIDELMKEMKKFNIEISDKNINDCEEDYKIIQKKDDLSGVSKTIISPSIMCKGVGYNAAKEIAAHRPYNNLRDLASKTSSTVDQDIVGSLVDFGFFNKQFKEANKGIGKAGKMSLEKFRENVQSKFATIRRDLKAASKKGVLSGDLFE
jgi:DNA polymerase-3 subunit alpha